MLSPVLCRLFLSPAVLDRRVGCTADDLSPLFSVTCSSDRTFHGFNIFHLVHLWRRLPRAPDLGNVPSVLLLLLFVQWCCSFSLQSPKLTVPWAPSRCGCDWDKVKVAWRGNGWAWVAVKLFHCMTNGCVISEEKNTRHFAVQLCYLIALNSFPTVKSIGVEVNTRLFDISGHGWKTCLLVSI